MDLKQLLEKKELILLDGAMGTVIQKSGVTFNHVPETLNVENPDFMVSVHKQYIDAGSDIVFTNTFGANAYKLSDCGYSVSELVRSAVSNAKKAAEGTDTLVALDIGPIGKLMEPSGDMTLEEAYGYYKEMILAGEEADLIAFETMTDLLELKAGVLAAKENSDKPILCSMSYELTGRTFTGVAPSAEALTLAGLGVDALGVNCSVGPKDLLPMVKELSEFTTLPLLIKPNAGLPDPATNEYDIDPKQFAKQVLELLPYGAKFIGGCCGTNPEYIATLAAAVADQTYTKAQGFSGTAVSSPSKTLRIDRPTIIGERINPTGKKKMQAALLEGDLDYILGMAKEEIQGGAEIINVNVGHPGVDEVELLPKLIRKLQGVCDLPLMIDTTNPKAMEAALRAYNGKAIVNSVNGEEEKLSTILPLVAKYGACVVGLTLNEDGIPDTAEGRLAIAKRIVDRAATYGIPKEDVFIDCLTLTISAEPTAAEVTVDAVKLVKEKLGCKTILGVSNISFGLPNRGLVNRTFLSLALGAGLDFPIINPNMGEMTDVVRAFRVLNQTDAGANEYIDFYKEVKASSQPAAAPKEINNILDAVYNGLKTEAAKATEQMLENTPSMVIINDHLIPALDKVGEDYERGELFLPQLIQSADAAQACFDVLKKNMDDSSDSTMSKGTVILATVKGDIHDIGKNIVKVLLENYGYTVLDLGKDVDPEVVVATAVKEDVVAVGLSALMTTTLPSMKETIALLRAEPALQNADGTSKVTIMVGGAVLTEEYAMQIGADYYCKDAKETVDRCKVIFG